MVAVAMQSLIFRDLKGLPQTITGYNRAKALMGIMAKQFSPLAFSFALPESEN